MGAAPGVSDVHTPGNTPLFVAEADAIDARYLLDGEEPAPDLDSLVAVAREDPLWRGVLVSEDGRTAALVVELESSDPTLHSKAVEALLEAVKAEAPRKYALVGDPIDFVAGGGRLNEEAKRLGAIAVLLVAATIWILFRKPSVVLPSLVTVGIAALWTLGLMGWMQWPETEISQALVPLLLVVGVCDAIHFLSRYRDLPGEVPDVGHLERPQRLELTARDVGWPCIVTSVTTAAGLASFATSDLVAFVNFGAAAAAGVLFALIATFTVLPVLVDLLRIEIPKATSSVGWVRELDILTRATERHALGIVVGSVLLLATAVWGIGQLRVDVTKESLLGSTSPIVKWQRWVAERIRRPDTLEVRLSLPEDSPVAEPAAMAVVERVGSFLQAQNHLGPVRSILDPVGRMNELIHDGDPKMRRPGTTRQQNEQLLLALSSYNGSFLASWLTPDRREVRLSIEADLLSKQERGKVLAAVSSFLDRELPAGWSYEVTGPLALFAEMVAAIHSTQLHSLTAAAVVILLLVAVCLRSLTAAAWVMIPTALPVALTLGAMGILDVPLDTGTAMIAAIVLGIAVDDSVHLVTRYKGYRFAGRERSDAMRRSMREVGRAVVATSIALAAGFLAMLLSSWGAIASFGFLSACAILLALLADLFLLPAIVFLVARRNPGRREEVHGAGRSAPDGRMRAALILLGGAVIALLLVKVGDEVLASDARTRPTCRPPENGVVALSSALVPGCPLRPFEVVRWLAERETAGDDPAAASFAVRRGGSEVRVSVPTIAEPPEVRLEAVVLVGAVSSFFLLMCFAILWRSPAPAALPLVAASTAAVALAAGVTLGPWSATAARAGTLGLAVLPSALFHLALTFPVERPLLRAVSRFLLVIYVPGAVAASVAIFTYSRGLWRGRCESAWRRASPGWRPKP